MVVIPYLEYKHIQELLQDGSIEPHYRDGKLIHYFGSSENILDAVRNKDEDEEGFFPANFAADVSTNTYAYIEVPADHPKPEAPKKYRVWVNWNTANVMLRDYHCSSTVESIEEAVRTLRMVRSMYDVDTHISWYDFGFEYLTVNDEWVEWEDENGKTIDKYMEENNND